MSLFSKLFGSKSTPAPSSLVREAFGGDIRVYEPPAGEDWQWLEDESERDWGRQRELKYRLPVEPMPLMLYAKRLELTEPAETVDDWKAQDWRGFLEGLMDEVDELRVEDARQTLMNEELAAVEVVASGTDPDGAPVSFRERRASKGTLAFIVTAVGPAPLMHARRSEVDRWFGSVAFAG